MKIGFAKDGRITALDMFIGQRQRPLRAPGRLRQRRRVIASLLYQPPAMRFRGMSVLTNTPPPRGPQSQPGGMQVSHADRAGHGEGGAQLGIDQVAIRRINAPEGKALVRPARRTAQAARGVTDERVRQGGARQGRRVCSAGTSARRRAASASARKVRGVGVAVSTFVAGLDRLRRPVRHQARRQAVHPVRHRQPRHRVGRSTYTACRPRCSAFPWEKGRHRPGATRRKNLPWTCVSGRQPDDPRDDARRARGRDGREAKLQEIAAKDLGGIPTTTRWPTSAFPQGRRAGMTLGEAAQRAIELGGKYDGHELPKDINALTTASATALAGQGLMGVARDNYPRDGQSARSSPGSPKSKSTSRPGLLHPRLPRRRRRRHGDPPAQPRGPDSRRRSMLGIGHAIGAEVGLRPALRVRAGEAVPSQPAADDPRHPAEQMAWAALDIPDPETPVGARGIGEPPVGAGACAVLNAISDALGDDIFGARR